MCKLGSIWPQKSDLLSGVQQANNGTLKRDIDYLFLSCSSLGTWSYSRNQTPRLSKLFTIYCLYFCKQRTQCSFPTSYRVLLLISIHQLMVLSLLMLISPHAQTFSSFGSEGFLGPQSPSAPARITFYPIGVDLALFLFKFFAHLGCSASCP